MIFQFALDYLQELLDPYIDINLTLWTSWVLTPLLVTFLLPLVIIFLFYTTAVILYIYKYKDRLRSAYEADFWDGARKTVAAIWDAHGWIWHGYEVQGLENVPENEPVLFVYYHGTIPVDLYYFISRYFLLRNKVVHSVADRFLFNIPGWGVIAECIKVIPGTIQTCTSILENGDCLAVSPGGVYEALFGDHNYELMWKKRLGFAKVALAAKVKIVPMFTMNVRESFRGVETTRRFWHWLYTTWRIPVIPIYGGFPVKLITYLGPAIEHNETMTPEDLKEKTAEAIERLIKDHQKLPGSIVRGMIDRVYRKPKLKENVE